jgi:hypothetical protein
MVPASEFFSRQLAILAKAIESVSENLSIAAAIGIALLGLLPDRAGSTLPPTAASAPIELVRAKPVPVPEAPPDAGPLNSGPNSGPKSPSATKADAPAALLKVAARRSQDRRGTTSQQQESGDLGKAGAPAQAEKTPQGEKTPVASADPKAAAKVEQPPPDEWSDDAIIGALKDCLKRLAPLGAEIEVSTPLKQEQCGTPAPVMLKRIGTGANRVEFQPPPMLNCAMVASLHAWVEQTLQPAAQEVLGSPIVRVRNASGYACRNRVGSVFHSDRLSEHALANAIDIAGFVTADGRTIDVARHWGPNARDIRRQEIEVAEAKAAATKKERERLEGELKVEREKLAKDKAGLPPAPKDAAARRERQKAQADLQQREKDLRRREAELREAEDAEARENERKSALERGTVKSAQPQPQKLGRVTDASGRAIPTTGTSDNVRRPAEASFLRRLHQGACGTFGTVLGPEANEAHRDHFHFDLAQRKRNAFCE